jgi:hypothetical protein
MLLVSILPADGSFVDAGIVVMCWVSEDTNMFCASQSSVVVSLDHDLTASANVS